MNTEDHKIVILLGCANTLHQPSHDLGLIMD